MVIAKIGSWYREVVCYLYISSVWRPCSSFLSYVSLVSTWIVCTCPFIGSQNPYGFPSLHIFSNFYLIISDSTEADCESKPLTSSCNVVKPKYEHQRRYIPSASSAMVIGSILGLIQAIVLIAGAVPLLNFMGIGSVSIAYNRKRLLNLFCCYQYSWLREFCNLLPILTKMSQYFVWTGIPYAKPCTKVLNVKITGCPCGSFIIGDARGLPRIQGYKNPFICNRYVLQDLKLNTVSYTLFFSSTLKHFSKYITYSIWPHSN